MCSGERAVKYISLAKPAKDAKNSVLFFSWRSLRENKGRLLSASHLIIGFDNKYRQIEGIDFEFALSLVGNSRSNYQSEWQKD